MASGDTFEEVRAILFLAAALLVLVAGVGYWVGKQSWTAPADPAVVAQIQRLNQLATVRYTVQKVVGIREPKTPVGEESILLIVQATVDAGIKLDQLTSADVTRRDGALVIRIPRAEILNVAIDENATKVWDRQKTWWTPWVPYSPDLESKARREGLRIARDAAIEMGILQQAEANAQTAIRSLLNLSGTPDVVVLTGGSS
jgi:hypothetical protein